MFLLPENKRVTVEQGGASSGSVLRGIARHNLDLRLRVLQDQPKGQHGPLQGTFVILDFGSSPHADSLQELLNQPTDAAAVLRLLRVKSKGCVSVANTNSLVREE